MLCDWELTYGDKIWSSGITYVPMKLRFMYLTAVIDWYSRYVGLWLLFNTLDQRFCLGSPVKG